MVLLQEYDTPQEAYIVKGMLESHGIEAYISQSVLSSVFPAPDSGTGAVGVYVSEQSLEKAKNLLRQCGDL